MGNSHQRKRSTQLWQQQTSQVRPVARSPGTNRGGSSSIRPRNNNAQFFSSINYPSPNVQIVGLAAVGCGVSTTPPGNNTEIEQQFHHATHHAPA